MHEPFKQVEWCNKLSYDKFQKGASNIKKKPKPAAVNAIGLVGWRFIWKGGFIVGEGPQQGEGWSFPGLGLRGGPGVGLHRWAELAPPTHPAASSGPAGLSKHTKQRPALSQGGHCLSEAKLLYLEA